MKQRSVWEEGFSVGWEVGAGANAVIMTASFAIIRHAPAKISPPAR